MVTPLQDPLSRDPSICLVPIPNPLPAIGIYAHVSHLSASIDFLPTNPVPTRVTAGQEFPQPLLP
jgi:hypothetical protein